jgi:Rieske Fe-S protein
MNPICFRARPTPLYRVVKPLLNNRPAAVIVTRQPSTSLFGTSTPKAMAQEYKLKGVTSLDLKPGSKQEVEVEGLDTKVLLLNDGTKVQAVGARCTHYGAPLVNGILTTNGRLTCPWHGG